MTKGARGLSRALSFNITADVRRYRVGRGRRGAERVQRGVGGFVTFSYLCLLIFQPHGAISRRGGSAANASRPCCGNKSRKCYRKKFTGLHIRLLSARAHTHTYPPTRKRKAGGEEEAGFSLPLSPINPVTILRVGSIVNYAVNIGTSDPDPGGRIDLVLVFHRAI